MKRSYLEHIKIVSFGAFSNKAVGPFAPHLNVVYGPNEAGKTTLASFVGGVGISPVHSQDDTVSQISGNSLAKYCFLGVFGMTWTSFRIFGIHSLCLVCRNMRPVCPRTAALCRSPAVSRGGAGTQPSPCSAALFL